MRAAEILAVIDELPVEVKSVLMLAHWHAGLERQFHSLKLAVMTDEDVANVMELTEASPEFLLLPQQTKDLIRKASSEAIAYASDVLFDFGSDDNSPTDAEFKKNVEREILRWALDFEKSAAKK